MWRLARFAGVSPSRSRSRAVATWAWSFRMLSMAHQMVGSACPTSFAKALFHPSHMLLVLDPPSRVMELTFHMGGGYIEGMRRILSGGMDPSGCCGG